MTDGLTDYHPSTPILLRFLTHLYEMPLWHKAVLAIAGVLGVAGVSGKLAEPSNAQPATAIHDSASPSVARDNSSRSIVSQSNDSTSTGTNDSPTADSPPPSTSPLQDFLVAHGPWMRRVGPPFIAAFVLGWIFRAFVKMMTTLATFGAIIFFGLSYFGVTNVDLTAAKEKYADTIQWMNGQAEKAKDALVAHLPATGSTMAGFVVGFKRKRM